MPTRIYVLLFLVPSRKIPPMAVEYNNIVYDNTATPNQDAYDNVGQSDELNVKLPDNEGDTTLYAKNKRAKKGIKAVAATATIMVSAGASGLLIWNSFSPKPATVSNMSMSLVGRALSYSFEITKADKAKSYFSLYTDEGKNKGEFFIVDITAGGKFEGTTEIPASVKDGQSFTADIYGSNNFDYYRSYYKQIFTITVPQAS